MLAESLPQTADMHVDRARLQMALMAPNLIEQAFAAPYAARLLDEGGQKAKLGRTEIQSMTGPGDAVRAAVEAQISELQHPTDRRAVGPPQHRHHTGPH